MSALNTASHTPTVWLTFKEASAYTKLHQITLRRAVQRGQLRAFKLPKVVRFRQADLDAWLMTTPVSPEVR